MGGGKGMTELFWWSLIKYVAFTVAVECIKLQIYKYKKHSTNAFLARKKRDFRSM